MKRIYRTIINNYKKRYYDNIICSNILHDIKNRKIAVASKAFN